MVIVAASSCVETRIHSDTVDARVRLIEWSRIKSDDDDDTLIRKCWRNEKVHLVVARILRSESYAQLPIYRFRVAILISPRTDTRGIFHIFYLLIRYFTVAHVNLILLSQSHVFYGDFTFPRRRPRFRAKHHVFLQGKNKRAICIKWRGVALLRGIVCTC